MQFILVEEELVAKINEDGFDVDTVDGSGRGAIINHFPDVLAETTAHVEELVRGVAETGKNMLILRVFGEVEVEEVELADGGVGESFVGAVSLSVS